MNGADFRIFYEQFGIYKIAEYLKVSPADILHVSKQWVTSPHDAEYNGIKYDIKYSHPVVVEKGDKSIWDFSLRKVINGKRVGQNGGHCHYFLLIGMYNGIPKKVFLVPSKDAPTNHIRISITGTSKYHKYEI